MQSWPLTWDQISLVDHQEKIHQIYSEEANIEIGHMFTEQNIQNCARWRHMVHSIQSHSCAFIFLAVHNSSIGDLVTHSVTD